LSENRTDVKTICCRFIGVLALAAWAAVSAPGYAGAADRFAGDFLALGAGARALGMGGAFVAVTDGAVSSYYNPAGLVRMNGRETTLMHSEQFGGLENYNSLSFAAPASPGEVVGLTLIHLGVGDIPVTRLWDPSRALSDSNRVEVAYRTDAADYALFLGAGRQVNDHLATGVSVKILHRSLGNDTAYGFGIDLGAQFRVSETFRFGAVLRDATGTVVAWNVQEPGNNHTTKDRIRPTLDLGAECSGEAPWIGGAFTLAASMLFLGDSPDVKGLRTMHIGAEYRAGDILVFRAGSSEGHGTVGIGLARLPLIASSSLDYAFLSHADLDSTHRISMSIRF
jgi:hypothetical protein